MKFSKVLILFKNRTEHIGKRMRKKLTLLRIKMQKEVFQKTGRARKEPSTFLIGQHCGT